MVTLVVCENENKKYWRKTTDVTTTTSRYLHSYTKKKY